MSASQQKAYSKNVLDGINTVRQAEGLGPLALDETLIKTAQERAVQAAKEGEADPKDNRLPDLVAAGAFAMFALSHEVQADTAEKAQKAIAEDPLSKSKIVHPRLTHIGVGLADGKGGVFAVVDMGRLIPPADLKAAEQTLTEKMTDKRKKNSLEALRGDEHLRVQAAEIAKSFMTGTESSDALIAKAQKALGEKSFDLGRITIAFQVVNNANEIVIPQKISDPTLSAQGIGLAQGNNKDHDPGSIAVVIILAKPQVAHDAKQKLKKVPPPKSFPLQGEKKKESTVDQAWIATLSGNHSKAANLFRKAYKEKNDISLLYETARAQARDEKLKEATKTMKAYAALAKGEEKAKADTMVKSLEKGESIFSTAAAQQMSVEAKRFFIIGQRLFEQQQWEGAIDAFQQAYTYMKHPDIIYNIGLSHCRSGAIGEALDFFAEYKRFVPEARNIEEAKQLFAIGVELYQVGQFEAASRQFAVTYSFLPFPELVYNMGLCHMAMDQKDQAIRFFNEFLESDPADKDRKAVEKIIKSLK